MFDKTAQGNYNCAVVWGDPHVDEFTIDTSNGAG